MPSRTKNDYVGYTSHSDMESIRLDAQVRCVERLTGDVYDRLLAGRSGLSVLDIGCNRGRLTMGLFGDRPEIGTIVGLDISDDYLEKARLEYGGRASFYNLDCESPSFLDGMRRIMDELSIEAFDIVNISFVLLHLGDPAKVLSAVKGLLSPDGRVAVIDADDGMSNAYPDPNGIFRHTVDLFTSCATRGVARARDIYPLLNDCGYPDVRIETVGLSNVGMSPEELDDMYLTCMELMPMVASFSAASHPEETESLRLINEAMPVIHRMFYGGRTVFVAGLMMYTAGS